MKLTIGSIQRKGKRLYLVVRRDGRQRWLALKTEVAATARRRARRIAPSGDGDEDWLSYLARLGRRAEAELRARTASAALSWDGLFDEFLRRSGASVSECSRPSLRRWLRILESASGAAAPGRIGREDAEHAAASLAERYVSARRMVAFYRRIWQATGLDESIWETSCALKRCLREGGHSQEFYRRLDIAETRRLYAYLRETAPELADMVAIGHATGLRLSDVAELDTHEVLPGSDALSLVPNKTRRKKPRCLTIPLTREAAETVARRMLEAGDGEVNQQTGGHFLFSSKARHRPSRRLTAAFRACGISGTGNARASFHSLRATFISLMDEAGVSPHMTDAITGHGGGGMHARYTQPSLRSLREAVLSAIPPLLETSANQRPLRAERKPAIMK